MRRSTKVCAISLFALGAGCGDPERTETSSDPSAIQQPLSRGARGPLVRATYEYLESFGYYPSGELAALHPGWRPIIPRSPADRDLFDQDLERALRKLQVNVGLPPSGVLDRDTFDRLQSRVCGFPDRDPDERGRIDKWAVVGSGNRWTKQAITFRFASPNTGLGTLSAATTKSTITAAIKAWEAVTFLTFTEVSSGGDFQVVYKFIDGAGGLAGQAFPPPNQVINFDTANSWTTDFLSRVAVHESGHVIGLNHSSLGSTTFGLPAMNPTAPTSTLTDDDKIAANVMYNDWQLLPGLAIDIAVNTTSTFGFFDTIWVLGTDHVPYRWNESIFNWDQFPGVTGNKIAVDPSGDPWVVMGDGQVARRRFGAWEAVPGGGLLVDIGIGANGQVAGIGFSPFQAFAFSSSAGGWVFLGGPTNQVAIDVGPNGGITALTSSGEIWLGPGNWQRDFSGLGIDIGKGGTMQPIGGNLGGMEHSWLIGLGDGIWVKNFQPAGSSGSPPPAAADGWVQSNGAARRIAVGTRGRPWVVNSAGNIYRRNEL